MRGDIIAFYPHNFVDKIICKLGKTKYSHCGLQITKDTFISARFKGIEVLNISTYNRKYDTFRIKGLKKCQREKMIAFALNWEGRYYDFWGLIEYLTKLPLGKPGKFYCSEFLGLLALLVDKEVKEDIRRISPEEFTKQKWLRKVK